MPFLIIYELLCSTFLFTHFCLYYFDFAKIKPIGLGEKFLIVFFLISKMAQNKKNKSNKKKKLSAIVAAKKKGGDKSNQPAQQLNDNNPFERKQVRKHHTILGQKLKGEEIHLGQARSKSIEQRKNTLKLEYELDGKRSAFIDRRIGEKDESISGEEKMLIRFQKEKQKKILRKNLYSLGEEEGLTHMGQSLSSIENFEDFPMDDEDEGLNEEIVDEYHFGGGFVKKQPTEPSSEDKPKTRAEVMKEIIQKSKYYKELKQKQNEENEELTEELDSELPSLLDHFNAAGNLKKNRVEKDDFDLMVKELSFEPRAYATNRLKKPEEIASEQREKLALLEKERQKRMTSDHFAENDDANNDEEEEDEEDEDEEGDGDENDEENEDEDGEGEEDGEGDGEDDVEEEEDAENEMPMKKKRKIENEISADNLEDDFDILDAGDDNDNDDEDEEEEEEDDDFNKDERNQKKKIFLTESELKLVDKSLGESSIPFLINVPENYEEFSALFANRPSKEQATLISRIFTSNSSSIGATFKPKMEVRFFEFFLSNFFHF